MGASPWGAGSGASAACIGTPRRQPRLGRTLALHEGRSGGVSCGQKAHSRADPSRHWEPCQHLLPTGDSRLGGELRWELQWFEQVGLV